MVRADPRGVHGAGGLVPVTQITRPSDGARAQTLVHHSTHRDRLLPQLLANRMRDRHQIARPPAVAPSTGCRAPPVVNGGTRGRAVGSIPTRSTTRPKAGLGRQQRAEQ